MSWQVEEAIIRGDIVFIIMHDDEGRGSIQTRSPKEVDQWRLALAQLPKSEPKPSGR